MCWHKWSKWEEYEKHCYYSPTPGSFFYIGNGELSRKKRYCLKCGKVQDELIR